MFTTLSNIRRFQVVSFVLAIVCFASLSLCQSKVMGQIDTIQNSWDVSIQSDDVGVSGDASSADNQGSKKKSGKFRLLFWGIVMLAIFWIGGKPLLWLINILSGGKFRDQNSDSYDVLMQMPDPQPIQWSEPEPEPEPEPQTAPQSSTSETSADSKPVEDMSDVPQDEQKDEQNNEKENK